MVAHVTCAYAFQIRKNRISHDTAKQMWHNIGGLDMEAFLMSYANSKVAAHLDFKQVLISYRVVRCLQVHVYYVHNIVP